MINMAEEEVDIVICGSGSAGICAATWLARYGVPCKIIDSRSGPMEIGQADGVQCRTVEVFESFNMAEDLLREAYHVLEVAFWSSSPEVKEGGILRTGRAADTAPGLSHMPHVILNQARINGLLIEAMERYNGQKVDYGYSVKSVHVDDEAAKKPDAHAVTVVTEQDGKERILKAKYVLGCDGAHSAVRRSLGYKMIGDTSDAVWGVMDVYPQTNFPDVRRKCAIQSKAGSLLIVPREGDALARFYIELPEGTKAKEVSLEDLQNTARRIFAPYQMDFAGTFWWSAYAIGQRLADHFSKANRVFLTGDACHTHSPKAGQGMNTSLQDGYNIGWKLAMIMKGQAGPELLETYDLERGKVAANLISFDKEYTKLFSSKSKDKEKFREHHIMAGRYTAGLTATYDDSAITSAANSTQSLAKNLVVGMRFPSTQVVRHSDAKAMQLVKALPADGRWRIVIFAGDILKTSEAKKLTELASFLGSPEGPVRKYTPSDADIDSCFEPIVVLSGPRIQIEQDQIPEYFWPVTGKWRMRDLHKIFVDDESYNSGHGRAYEFYGVDPGKGAVAVVRPDQYVSLVIALEDHDGIGRFFEGFAKRQP